MKSILSYTAVELSKLIKNGAITAVEATEATLRRIEELEPQIHAYITVDGEVALKKAAMIQEKICRGELTGPLVGVPMAIKDNICTKGLKTTCASKMLQHFIPPYSAEAVTKLERAGTIILGKTNMDEFAMGSTTETSVWGPTKNPWNIDYVPGGSSGGSAAAVAAGECYFALGTDTGGSVRQPAAHCGVVGLKPTYGRVSRYGLIAYASSLDQIGPIAKDVTDCAAIMEAIAGYDSKDSTSIKNQEKDFTAALIKDVKGMRIGIPMDYFGEEVSPAVRAAVSQAARVLEQAGAIVEEFTLGYGAYAASVYYTIATAEASSNLERYDGVKYGYRAEVFDGIHDMYKKTRSQGFGAEVKRRILLGSFVLSEGYYDAYYLKALQVKSLIKKAFDRAFDSYDILLTPVTPDTAPLLGESLQHPLSMYAGDVYTISANLAGLPAISVPCGRGEKELPIGLQFIADSFCEKKLIQVAYTYEQTI